MGFSYLHVKPDSSGPSKSDNNNLIITGLGSEWPSKSIGPKYALKLYPDDAGWLMLIIYNLRLNGLVNINEQIGIESRAVIYTWDDPKWHLSDPPKEEDVDAAFCRYRAELAKNAALKALNDANIYPTSITRMVTATATNAGSPGYDQLVAPELGCGSQQKNGVGCAGRFAALRVASNLALVSTLRGQPARVLVVACEICSTQVRAELHAAGQLETIGIGPALFGDGASALVLCNARAVDHNTPKRFLLIDWRTHITPNTEKEMASALVAASVEAPFQILTRDNSMASFSPSDFDWALHPGGSAIIKGV
ncbi:Chalcone synthase B [Talaromyces pinophilus]|nr:Chalcone synthase B [Talaromyces pinophilus]